MARIFQTGEFIEQTNKFESYIRELRGFVSSLTSIPYRNIAGLYEKIDQIESTVNIFIANINQIPDVIANNFYGAISSYNNYLESRFNNFDVKDPEYNSSILKKITSIFDELQPIHESMVRYLTNIESDTKKIDSSGAKHTIDSLLKEINSIKHQTTNDAKQIELIKQTLQNEINTLNTKYKEDLSKFENISQALTFQNTANTYQLTANSWRKTVIGLCLLLFGLLLAFGYYTWIDFDQLLKQLEDGRINASTSRINTLFYYEIVSKSVLRLMVLSLAVFFIKFSVKNYNAAKHNMITNLHKANSLATASRLIATSPDTETFNAIITLAAREIFTQPKTGFLQRDDSKVDIGLLNDTISTFAKKG